MKKLYIILFSGVILSLASCKKDKSNYDFQSKEAVKITGFESSYTLISEKDKLVLDPELTSTDPEADLEYLWGVYETNVQGYSPVLDTIARTKKLDFPIKLTAKDWVLVFRVTNKKTGYAQYFNSTLKVVTEFTRGWYVAKDDGTQSDLDLFLTPTSIMPGEKRENVYSFVNGNKLQGKARILTVFTGYKSTVTGTLGNTKTLFYVTDKDISAIYMSTLKPLRTFDNLFIGSPGNKAPSSAFFGSSANYLVNDGQMYAIYAMSANSGQFGARKMKDAQNTPYHLADHFLVSGSSDPYVFDETSSSFLSMSMGFGSFMTAISDEERTVGTAVVKSAMPANNNNKKLLYMGFKNSVYLPAPEYRNKISGYAMFQDKTDPSLKILSLLEPNRTKMFITNDTLKTTDKIYNATRFAVLDGDENIIYFVVGDQVWTRNLSNKHEELQYTVPGGEEITFMRHRKYTETGYTYNYIMLGTKSGPNYKVRMFTKSSGNLSATPAFTLEGSGIVRDVIYIAPSVSEYTYNNSY